jgi:preprotein translocase subunit SecG
MIHSSLGFALQGKRFKSPVPREFHTFSGVLLTRHKEVTSNPMVYLLVVLHIIVSIFLVGVVLLQQGKSADLAGAFGGQGSQTAFGPRGAANLLTKLTTYSAVVFMLTSIGLTIMLSRAGGDHSVLSGTSHPVTQTTPAKK